MPTLRPLTEVARYDARFVADVVAPALRAAGFAGDVVVAAVSEAAPPDAIVIHARAADLEALLAGRQKTELSALDKLRAQKHRAPAHETVTVRGRASALRALVRALRPVASASTSSASRGARDIGAEAGVAPKRKARDRVRRAGGGYIKGRKSVAPPLGAGAGSKSALAPMATARAAANAGGAVLSDTRAPPADRAAFAMQNLAAFVEAGLARAALTGLVSVDVDVDVDVVLVIAPGEVRRV